MDSDAEVGAKIVEGEVEEDKTTKLDEGASEASSLHSSEIAYMAEGLDKERMKEVEEDDAPLTPPPAPEKPDETYADKKARLVKEIIVARGLKGRPAYNEAVRIIKVEGLLPKPAAPKPKAAKAKAAPKPKPGAAAAAAPKGVKRSSGGAPMDADKQDLLTKILAGGAVTTLEEYTTVCLLLKSQRQMLNRKLNAKKPADEESQRVVKVERAQILAAAEFDPKYVKKGEEITMNEKKARNAIVVIAEGARDAVVELRVKDAEIARLRAELAARPAV